MPRTVINPGALHPPPGYSHVTIATGSRLAFVAGQAAIDPDFTIVGGDDLHAQTTKTMENLAIALAEIGAGWEDVVKSTVYTTRPHDFAVIADAMGAALGDAKPPAQVLAGVTGLALPELLVEIELVVSLP